ncbi:MAG: hypothetical protein ACI82S_002415 [Patiriisocius sp.]|jgi:hypothetical protein
MIEHKIKRGESLTLIAQNYDLKLNRLLAFNPQYKANPDNIRVGELVHIPKPKENILGASTDQISSSIPTATQAKPNESAVVTSEDDFTVAFGQLTFDVEGMEKPGRYFSRKLHVPSSNSGITIGRGYDMKLRSVQEIIEDMTACGVASSIAEKLGACSVYKGNAGERFILEQNLTDLEISPAQQKALFTITYHEMEDDVIRICNKADVVAKYGKTHWAELDPVIRDIAIDLRYRGDYKPATRKQFQPIMVENNRSGLNKLMADEYYWLTDIGVPENRFARRKNYC